MDIVAGTYRHFKGGEYEVIGVATHSETHESLVVYRPLYGEMNLWCRPAAMFAEKVEFAGKLVDRFQLLAKFE
jgi:succinyl-diaminopimelate desuccinylase